MRWEAQRFEGLWINSVWIYGGDKGVFWMAAHIPGMDGNNGSGWSGKVCRVTKWCWETVYVCINTWSLRHLTSAEEYPDEEYLDMSKSSSLKYKRHQQLWVGQQQADNPDKLFWYQFRLSRPLKWHKWLPHDRAVCGQTTTREHVVQKQKRTTLCSGRERGSKRRTTISQVPHVAAHQNAWLRVYDATHARRLVFSNKRVGLI